MLSVKLESGFNFLDWFLKQFLLPLEQGGYIFHEDSNGNSLHFIIRKMFGSGRCDVVVYFLLNESVKKTNDCIN